MPERIPTNTERIPTHTQRNAASSRLLPGSFFRVPLVCEAAPSIGCGTRAKPVLEDLERQPSVREAWLNREGTVVGIVWADGPRERNAVLSTLSRHGIAGVELNGPEYVQSHESFAAGGWCRPMQMQDLSDEEARVIAARLVRRLERDVSLSAEIRERLATVLERACSEALATASATSAIERREQIASALHQAAVPLLDPAQLAAFEAAVSLGHRPLPSER